VFQHRVGITKSEERANAAAFATFTGDLHSEFDYRFQIFLIAPAHKSARLT
jgi:hypothetical protein